MAKRPDYEYEDEYEGLDEATEYTRRELTEEEEFELRRERRRRKQLEQRRKAKRREKIFVAAFLLIFITIVVGIFLIIRANRKDSPKKADGKDLVVETTEGESLETAAESTTAAPASETAAVVETPAETAETIPVVIPSETAGGDVAVTNSERETTDPLNSTDENGNWIPPYPTDVKVPSWITEDYIDINEKTRPGRALTSVDNIVVHYVGNPGTSAKANRDFFNDIPLHADEKGASANFIVGFDGEIIICVPLGEMAQANYPRNDFTISIETCHPDVTGKFTETTYRTLIKLVAWLCEEYGLTEQDVIRHYDVSGKYCPIYYCPNTPDNPYGHPEEWEKFKMEVAYYMLKYPNIAETDP